MTCNAVFALALAAALGCSISNSSQSFSNSSQSFSNSSNSVSNSSSSSSRSSSPEDDAAYREDVRDYTVAYLRSGGEFAAYLKGLGDLARSHGIANWEAQRATYRAIGEGLGKADASRTQLDLFKTNLAGSSPEKMRDIQDGYESLI